MKIKRAQKAQDKLCRVLDKLVALSGSLSKGRLLHGSAMPEILQGNEKKLEKHYAKIATVAYKVAEAAEDAALASEKE